jgi:RecB family exonuclease
LKVLLTGPPASGKSRAAVESFLARPGALLLVPTATMAEHLRHQLARAGAAVRPSAIQTLGGFLDQWSPAAAVPLPLLHLLLERALARLRIRRFERVADLPGFIAALARALSDPLPASAPADLRRLRVEIGGELAARGMAWREQRLRLAAERAPARETLLDGFFTLSEEETAFAAALGNRAPVTLTLPDWEGASSARAALLAAGFEERRFDTPRRAARLNGFSAATIEHEAAEIAARIREEAAAGRPFREMGVVLRVREPYAPLLETAFDRQGIPARFYFTDPLASHPAVDYLLRIVRAWLAGWDHAELLPALRMPASGLGATPQGDALDFELRERLPGSAGLQAVNDTGFQPVLEHLSSIPPRLPRAPVEWSHHLKTLRALIPIPQPCEPATRDQVQVWRSTAAALNGFDAALDAAASALGDAPCPLDAFLRQLETALALEPLRIADQRRNVVHVMDVYEARQWELPVVFVCGLTERHFPQYHGADPILRDPAASAALQREEAFLYEIATSRATHETILSYPRFDENGAPTLPSFFLAGELTPAGPRSTYEAKPAPPPAAAPLPVIHDRLSASAIESFLQCPFQFFARHTLRLRPRPPAPRDRLDARLQGSILHRALAELAETPRMGAAVLDRVFEAECAKHSVPRTYRTEAVRLELLRHFQAFLADRRVRPAGWRSTPEQRFEFALTPQLTITGRIDRLDQSPDGRALVIDYKYSAAGRIQDHVEGAESGEKVQAGLYLAAARRAFGLEPAGMLYCGVKKRVTWGGWHASIPGLEEIGERCLPQLLEDLIRAAEQSAIAVQEAAAQGRIAPQPADPGQCAWCDFADICRIEAAPAARRAGGA